MEFTCVFCYRPFARSDALKRHWSTCRVRRDHGLDVPASGTKTRGRKARACDRCSRLKQACNSKLPCAPCMSRKLDCTYRRRQYKLAAPSSNQENQVTFHSGIDIAPDLIRDQSTAPHVTTYMDDGSFPDMSEDPLHGESSSTIGFSVVSLDYWNTSWAPVDEHALAASIFHRPTELDVALLARFPFLENLTRATGFVTSFQCGTLQKRLSIIEELVSSEPLSYVASASVYQSRPHIRWIETTWNALTAYDGQGTQETKPVTTLMPKTHEIVSEIRRSTVMKQYQSSANLTWSHALEAHCYEFFHPASLQKYLALFWSCWYPNWPTIHRPTFDAISRSHKLVAAMALMGACLSPDERDRVCAQMWFNSVEDIVFGDGLFLQEEVFAVWRNSGQKALRTNQLDILQAAYCVCLYQTWEGDRRSRRRILRHRFSDLVYLTRDIGLGEASLESVNTSILETFDWEEYILRESLIRYAEVHHWTFMTLTFGQSLNSYICNIDASYGLLFRVAPRMTLSELVMELPSPESCFQARSKEECFTDLMNWRSRSGLNANKFTIRAAIEVLSDPGKMARGNTQQAFSHLSVLSMFTIIHVLYGMVHYMQRSGIHSLDTIKISPVGVALHQWGRIWPSLSRDAELIELTQKGGRASHAWQNIGFIRHAPEYWLLAYLTLKQLSERPPGASTLALGSGEREDSSMERANALIVGLRYSDLA